MKRTLFAALLLGAGTAFGAAPALAADPQLAQTYVPEPVRYEQGTGFYGTIGLGAQWPSGNSFNRDVNNFRNFDDFEVDGRVGYGGGFSGDIGIGYDFGAWRAELTYGYSRASVNDVNDVDVDFNGGRIRNVNLDASGIVNKNDVLVSAYWDIPTGSAWVPYVGGGIGWTNLGTPNINVAGENIGGGNQSAFGWQAKLGVSYVVSRSTDVFVEGVYQGASSVTTDNVEFGAFNSWGAKVGARFRFGADPAPVAVVEPAPEPAPAPAPEPAPAPAPEPIRGLW